MTGSFSPKSGSLLGDAGTLLFLASILSGSPTMGNVPYLRGSLTLSAEPL